MTDADGPTRRDRAIAIAAVVIILLAAPATVALAQTLSHQSSAGVTYVTNSGTEVTLTDDRQIRANPFARDDTWATDTVVVEGSGGDIAIGDQTFSGETITVTDVDATGGAVGIERTDLGRSLTVESGDANTVEIRNLTVDDGAADLAYNSDNGVSVTVSDLPTNVGIGAADPATGTVYDSVTSSSGTETFALPSGTNTVALKTVPSELQVRNEAQPDQLIDGNVTLRARFFAEDEVIERQVTDGTVSLAGLPADQQVVVTVKEENADYTYRRILLDNIVETSEIYLLPTSEPSAEVQFELADETGRFDAEDTRMYIEKPITRNNNTEYRVIAGDRLGADGAFPTVLVDSERYRLRVENEAGEQRVLGSYTVQGAEIARIPIGEVQFSGDVSEGAALQASLRAAPDSAAHNHEARIVYLDPEGETSDITISVENETGAALRPETTESLNGTTEAYVETYPLSTDFNPEQDSATVTVDAQRGFETETFTRQLGDVPEVLGDAPIDPRILELMGFVSIIALIGLLVIQSPPLAALVGSGYAGLLAVLGIVPIPIPAVVLAGLVGVLATVGINTGGLR
jgi:hypothetical protein